MFADANCASKRNANGYIYSNTYDHAQCHRNSDKYSNSYDYTYRYTLGDSNGYGQTNTYSAASPNTETTSHAGAAPLKQPSSRELAVAIFAQRTWRFVTIGFS